MLEDIQDPGRCWYAWSLAWLVGVPSHRRVFCYGPALGKLLNSVRSLVVDTCISRIWEVGVRSFSEVLKAAHSTEGKARMLSAVWVSCKSR